MSPHRAARRPAPEISARARIGRPRRNYTSTWATFTGPDPAPWNLADPQTLDRYVYTAGNPVTLTDPTGLTPCAGKSGAPCKVKNVVEERHPGSSARKKAHKKKKPGFFQRVKQAILNNLRNQRPLSKWQIMLMIASGNPEAGAADLVGAEAGAGAEAGESLQYDDRIAARSAEDAGPYHNFPGSFDREVIQNGEKTVGNDGYTQYNLRGSINGREGTYEIGVKDGRIVHRFFRPDP